MAFGLGEPRRPILGSEVAGETAAAGEEAGRFRKMTEFVDVPD